MVLKLKYLDTVEENVERLRKARDNMNLSIILMGVTAVFMFCIGLYLYLELLLITGIYFFIMGMMDIILLVGIVLKRETYSLVILIKESMEVEY